MWGVGKKGRSLPKEPPQTHMVPTGVANCRVPSRSRTGGTCLVREEWLWLVTGPCATALVPKHVQQVISPRRRAEPTAAWQLGFEPALERTSGEESGEGEDGPGRSGRWPVPTVIGESRPLVTRTELPGVLRAQRRHARPNQHSRAPAVTASGDTLFLVFRGNLS